MTWEELILGPGETTAAEVWADIFAKLQTVAESAVSPVSLHEATVTPDRLLAETAWELWAAYPTQAPKISAALKRWAKREGGGGAGRAVLIVDALSLQELPYILGAAQARDIAPTRVQVMGAECPSSTDQFAAALGLPGRAALAYDKKSGNFALFDGQCRTEVLSAPFADCSVPPAPYIVFWHTWLDDLIHVQNKAPDAVGKAAASALQGNGFWNFINALRQGRELVITSDHGYALSKLFSSEISDPEDAARLREVFKASRHVAAAAPRQKFMPPLVLEHGGYHVIMGQWKWKAAGGFPQICHGGMSLLEAAVPWLEFAPL
jgi:hypothetical protein